MIWRSFGLSRVSLSLGLISITEDVVNDITQIFPGVIDRLRQGFLNLVQNVLNLRSLQLRVILVQCIGYDIPSEVINQRVNNLIK